MSIAVKIIVFSFIITFISILFPTNILTLLNIPLLSITVFVDSVAHFINNIASFGDVFLVAGSTILMIKAVTLVVFFYLQFRVFYAFIKLIAY